MKQQPPRVPAGPPPRLSKWHIRALILIAAIAVIAATYLMARQMTRGEKKNDARENLVRPVVLTADLPGARQAPPGRSTDEVLIRSRHRFAGGGRSGQFSSVPGRRFC